MNTDKPAEALRPCPFCGGTAVTVQEGSTFRWCVAVCDGCGAQAGEVRVQTLGDGTKEEWETQAHANAIEEWNRRTQPAQAAQYAPDWPNGPDREPAPAQSVYTGEELDAIASRLDPSGVTHDLAAIAQARQALRHLAAQPVGVTVNRATMRCYLGDLTDEWADLAIRAYHLGATNGARPMNILPVAYMRRHATYQGEDGRRNGERIVSEFSVYPDDIPLYEHPPAQPVGVPDGLTEAELSVIETLLNLAYSAWNLADNTEDAGGKGLTVERSDFAGLETQLNELDSLPDDRPDYVMAAAAKARWALRRLLTAAPQPPAQPSAIHQDNEKAADSACLTLIGMGYAWTGKEWIRSEGQPSADAEDAARLDWIERIGFATKNEYGDKPMNVHCWRDAGKWKWTAHWIDSNFPTARAAIDAARAKEKGE